ncbi:hypothetical protein PoB_000997600 [Plakobranchus ocellatus]|uniref:Uncharacterized protein n=1 Tax=Plakobranchus ocellatus TaxID=259542 RepID=A0AAV3YM45_9GAST|nr:hypothetical protein PoB_000997600 [Plakobranchus ocellatus]
MKKKDPNRSFPSKSYKGRLRNYLKKKNTNARFILPQPEVFSMTCRSSSADRSRKNGRSARAETVLASYGQKYDLNTGYLLSLMDIPGSWCVPLLSTFNYGQQKHTKG